jgi:acyl-CoA thioesterase I
MAAAFIGQIRRGCAPGYGVLRRLRNSGLALLLPIAAAAEPLTIAALGDSLTQGYGLPTEDGFVPQMEAWLQAQGADVVLINAGVSGDTTAGGLSRVGWTLTPDVDLLIVALGGNDMLRGIDPALTRQNLDGILQAATQAGVRVLLVGMEAPGNFGPEYKAEFDAIYPELAKIHETALFPNFFGGLLDGDRAAAMQVYMQSDNIHPNAEGVGQIVAAMGPVLLDFMQALD